MATKTEKNLQEIDTALIEVRQLWQDARCPEERIRAMRSIDSLLDQRSVLKKKPIKTK